MKENNVSPNMCPVFTFYNQNLHEQTNHPTHNGCTCSGSCTRTVFFQGLFYEDTYLTTPYRNHPPHLPIDIYNMLLLPFLAGLCAQVHFTVAAAATGVQGTCQCDDGDFWCSDTNVLKTNYNCSIQQSIYNTILNSDEGPTTKQCQAMAQDCIQQPAPITNQTCSNDCYNFCWIQDVGDCADDDDSQTLCVSLCQDWCVRDKCGARTPWSNNQCEHACAAKYMDVQEADISFVDYTECMANKCTTTPV